VIIILAVALSSRNGTKQAEVQPAANEAAFAITNAEPTSLATLLTAEGTSIAYGGEGLFQATMAMQSTFYAGTPVPSATGVPSTTPLVMIPTGTPTPSSGMVAEAQAGLHASPSEEISMADNVPVTEPELAAQPSAAEAPTLPPSSAPSALGAAAQEGAPQNGVPAPPSGSLEGETGAAQAPQIAQSEGGFREGTDNETQVTLAPTNSATRTQPNTPTPRPALDQAMPATEMALPTTPPESPVFSAPGPTEIPAPLEVAQAPPAEGDAFKTGAERRAAEQGQTHNLWWLAGLGAVTLVISAGLFVAGRRKARRA
jgi:hypothetical protein